MRKTAAKDGYRVTIVGASGAVGREVITCLARSNTPIRELVLLASGRSAGTRIDFQGEALTIRPLEESLPECDLIIFCATADVSRKFVPKASQQGAVAIDNSSAFRLDPGVPLIVPEINGELINSHRGIIANPNCSTIIALMALWPIHRQNPITRVNIATYQAASGAGSAAMDELVEGSRAFLEGRSFTPKALPHVAAFNVFSHNSPVDASNGYNGEELKMRNEMRKILQNPTLRISATCMRVPVLRAHSEAILFECLRPTTADALKRSYEDAKGVRVVEDYQQNRFPMPLEATGSTDVLVGRIRPDLSDETGRAFWLLASGDQLLKGAAYNAVQIVEHLSGA